MKRILMLIAFIFASTGAYAALTPELQSFKFVTGLKTAKLDTLIQKQQNGGQLTAAEEKAVVEANEDAKTMASLSHSAVCEVHEANEKAKARQPKSMFSLGGMVDCATLSPEQLKDTHVSVVTISSSLGGPVQKKSYRYPGTDEQEKQRVNTVQKIAKKWQAWEKQ